MQQGHPHEVIHLACRELTALLGTAAVGVLYILLIPSTGRVILSSNLAAKLRTLPVLTGGGDSTALMALQTSRTSVLPLNFNHIWTDG